jgi:hypothetical protein
MCDLLWTKWYWGMFSPRTSVCPTNSHSTDCSTLIIYLPGLILGTVGQSVADAPSGLSLTPPEETKAAVYYTAFRQAVVALQEGSTIRKI